ncbi:MAG: hypothetical protein SCK57_06185 [Bacillota bacterium]|nr:hypothetical protein [Bacillota bacterium]MDW7677233.1 hypothetical protein [Bacillota bacterium]
MKKRKYLVLALIVCMVLLLFPVNALAAPAQNAAAASKNFKFASAASLDGRDRPAIEYSRPNRLPSEMIGYWEKSFDVNGEMRTAKVYIAPDTPIRSYYTVIAVPNGEETADFLLKSGWKDLADQKEEGLFVLEPGANGWGSAEEEQAYVTAAMGFYMSNSYFSIFGEHYLVGYAEGAPPLEAWAVANPLRVISQVYIDSEGLESDYFDQYASLEFGGVNPPYTTIEFPDGFEKATYAEALLPTWFINPADSAADSIAYWKAANETVTTPAKDNDLGLVFRQAEESESWMTAHSGPISKVVVLERPVSYWNKKTQRDIQDFLFFYSRYENVIAYGNQLIERADYAKLGIEFHTMEVNGYPRQYMVYVPDSAAKIWGDAAPLLWVWAGNSQTDKVFLDATQWWKVAQEEGFIMVIPSERTTSNAIAVTYADTEQFFLQLREVMFENYPVDPTRSYATGHSAGSMRGQGFAVAKPEYYAAIASTSGGAAPNDEGNITIEDATYPASYQMIPNYFLYGFGDLAGGSNNLRGTLWDAETNMLDNMAGYFLSVNGFDKGDGTDFVESGFKDRFVTWTWTKEFEGTEVPLYQITKNMFRSHNTIHEEMPLLWDYVKHFSFEVDEEGNVTRYYSESGFKVAGDEVKID